MTLTITVTKTNDVKHKMNRVNALDALQLARQLAKCVDSAEVMLIVDVESVDWQIKPLLTVESVLEGVA